MHTNLVDSKPDVAASWPDGSFTNDGKSGAGFILYQYLTDLPPIEHSLHVKNDSTADECEWRMVGHLITSQSSTAEKKSIGKREKTVMSKPSSMI